VSNLNLYGDVLISTSGGHGSDISSQRLDDLDIQSLRYLLDCLPSGHFTCYDIGCGLGFHGFRFSVLGATSILVDTLDLPNRIYHISRALALPLSFHHMDLRLLSFPSSTSDIILYSQRTLHYVPYGDVCHFLVRSKGAMSSRSRFFLSFSGLDSELGIGYPAFSLPLNERFHHLCPSAQDTHQIHVPICLYSLSNMTDLAHDCGLQLVSSWTSPFGNVKAVFTP
jgi:hypothetical protein